MSAVGLDCGELMLLDEQPFSDRAAQAGKRVA
jgi:hypothetical protein